MRRQIFLFRTPRNERNHKEHHEQHWDHHRQHDNERLAARIDCIWWIRSKKTKSDSQCKKTKRDAFCSPRRGHSGQIITIFQLQRECDSIGRNGPARNERLIRRHCRLVFQLLGLGAKPLLRFLIRERPCGTAYKISLGRSSSTYKFGDSRHWLNADHDNAVWPLPLLKPPHVLKPPAGRVGPFSGASCL